MSLPTNSNPTGLHLKEEITDSSQAVGDAGFALAQPVVVRDADVVHVFKESVLSRKHKIIQTLRSRFLHPLEAEFDVDGKVLQQEERCIRKKEKKSAD